MRLARVDGKIFNLPKYVYRVDDARGTHGWQVRYRGGEISKFFKDEKSAEVSFQRAVKFLAAVYDPNAVPVRRRQPKGDLPVGITLRRKIKNGVPEHYFVCRIGTLAKEIYVGTDTTWAENYYKKLVKAEECRAKLIEKSVVSKRAANVRFAKSLKG